MPIPEHLLPSDLLFCAHFIGVVVLLQAVRYAPWRQLWAAQLQHLFLGAVVVLSLLWSFNAGLQPGLGFHFMGVTVFTLMFGWSLGVIGVSLACLGLVLHRGGLETLSLNALLFGVLPVSLSYGVYYWVHHQLPQHVVIYIFLCAFLGSIVAAGVTVFALVGVLVTTGAYSLHHITEAYLPFLPLYLLPEGILNGMLTTIFIGLRPHWLKTFDEESYLKR